MITKQEILQLLNDTECHNVERTISKNDMDKFCQAICAFSFRTTFKVVENVSKKYFEEGFGTDSQKTSRNHPENIQKNRTLQQQIIDAIQSNPTITRKELIYLLNSTEGSVKYHLSQLIKKGRIKREGSDRTGTWIVIEYLD